MIIAGAGGHAREIFMLLSKEEKSNVYFFDNVTASVPEKIGGVTVLRSEREARLSLEQDPRFIVGTGNPAVRKKLFELFAAWGGEPFTFRSSTAIISELETVIGEGANIMHDVFISSHVKMGKGCLINTRANLHHDVVMGDFCEIAPAALLLGQVRIGNNVFIGAGAILLPGIEVADGAVIGAGAVVTKHIISDRTVKGVPAV
ncbi:NeuD/PglB/VioB family sugar acetyltransferase [Flavisolibacter sp. BT320]|nr:NeuD/PglB/VioB family sugar acetyltransferase [Flavisolibacter longurius]